MHSTPALPPVFVLNPYYSGLGVARSLRGHGVAVHGLASERDLPGARSRAFHAIHDVPNGRDDPDALCRRLLELAARQASKPVLFPTRDFDVIFLERYGSALAPAFVLPQPSASPILHVMDKLVLANVAAEAGIDAPRTAACDTLDAVMQSSSALSLPLVIKPRFAYQWRGKGSWERVGAQKAFIAESLPELRALYQRIATVGPEVLLQEYIPGDDADIVVCCCHMRADGTMDGYFTGRKLQQNPPLVGTGCVIEACEVPDIVATTTRLLAALGYAGIAEIEYKVHRETGRHMLIEVNPRHWDQHELGLLVGVNITWLAYAGLVGIATPVQAPVYRAGERYKWIAENELVRGFGAALRARWPGRPGASPGRWAAITRSVRELAGLVRGRRMLAMWRWSDPRPGLITAGGLAAEVARRGRGALRSRSASAPAKSGDAS
jgi:D-aspartate ligase